MQALQANTSSVVQPVKITVLHPLRHELSADQEVTELNRLDKLFDDMVVPAELLLLLSEAMNNEVQNIADTPFDPIDVARYSFLITTYKARIQCYSELYERFKNKIN